jgi:uncharacterized protein
MTTAAQPNFPELGPPPSRGVCVPLAPRVPVTTRVQQLVDSPMFQRLKGVRQLALAHLVYPDALHSRFGHSLGVYQRAARYVQALWVRESYDAFRTSVGEKGIAALLVSALLHDCGHYPMAHCFEELIPTGASAEKLKHDKIVVRMLEGRLPAVLPPAELSRLQDTLKLWEIDLEDVIAIITGYRDVSKIDADVVTVLHSILDGPLDADKLDYVQRDSLHTGNPAGRAVDEDRLIDSLVLRSFREGLGIHEKGLHASQSLFDARSRMFASVYWHRLNRAANRMFTEALTVLLQNDPQVFQSAFEADFFHLDDEAMLRFVAQNIAEREAQYLITPLLSISGGRREIYRRVVTISAPPGSVDPSALRRHATEPHGQICQMYDWYLEGNSAAPKWRMFDSEAREHTLRVARLSLPQYEVLVDVPDTRFRLPVHNDEVSSSYLVHGHGPPIPVRLKDPLFGANIDNWRMNARKVRIFTSPKVTEALVGREEQLANDIRDLASQIFGG